MFKVLVDIQKILKEIEIQAKKEMLPIVGPEKGEFLAGLVEKYQPKRILEIGTLVGYSAIWLAKNLPEGGEIITLEVSRPSFEMARGNIQKAGLENKIEIIFGSALEVIPTLEGEFDFVFIDAEKKEYLNYLKAIELKLSKQAVVVADNVGKFPEKMHDYLDYVKNHAEYESQTAETGQDAMEISRRRP